MNILNNLEIQSDTEYCFSHNAPEIKDDAITALSAIPKSVTRLNLSYNSLGEIGNENIFKALPPNLTSLDLSDNSLNAMPLRQLLESFRVLPKSLTTLNLSNNFPNLRFVKIFDKFIKVLPADLTTLILSGNNLNDLSYELLNAVFKALPTGLITLELSFTNLGQKTDKELKSLFKALPASITFMQLRDVELNQKTDVALSQLLPSSVQCIITDKEKRDINKARLINNIEPQLLILNKKITELKQQNYVLESSAMKSIYVTLNLLKNKYNNGAIEYSDFKEQSLAALDMADSAVLQQFGCKELLINIALYIMGLALGYLPFVPSNEISSR